MRLSKKNAALFMLLEKTEEETANALGIRLSTLQRWLQEPHFSDTLQNALIQRKRASTRLACTALRNALLVLSENKDQKLAVEIAKLGKGFEMQGEEQDEMASVLKALEDDKQ